MSRRLFLRRRARGQIAIGFVVMMGLVLIFVGMTVNLGQMAQVRAAVSNSADAGALAGASWLASGQNEAAMIAGKMWNSLAMAQALFLVPFCPGRGFQAQLLWTRIFMNNQLRFRVWANGVMDASWNLGRRQIFTASVNNMLMRFNCAESLGFLGGGDLSQTINQFQKNYESGPNGSYGWSFHWTNCQEGARKLIHVADASVRGFPDAPPELVLAPVGGFDPTGLGWQYFEYRPSIPAGGDGSHFACNFEGTGIQTLPFFRILPIPRPDLTVPYGDVDATGIKAWDIPLRTLYPEPAAATTGLCLGGVCGLEDHNLPGLALAPSTINGGNGSISLHVQHTVSREGGVGGVLGLPSWDPTFLPAGADATAAYTAATVAPPQPRARARLTGAN